MFGFMAIAIALLLASVCVINMVSKINLTITRRFTDPLHNIFCTFTEDARRTMDTNTNSQGGRPDKTAAYEGALGSSALWTTEVSPMPRDALFKPGWAALLGAGRL